MSGPQAPGPGTRGVDVSHFQGSVNWQTLMQANVGFAYLKATDGITWEDPFFSSHLSATRACGLPRGAYHFFRSNDDPIAQANAFCAFIGKPAPGDLPPVLDFETDSADGLTPALRLQSVLSWLTAVKQKLGRNPILYTNADFIASAVTSTAQLAGTKLWIARYPLDVAGYAPGLSAPLPSAAPNLPAGWTQWTFWQYTAQGQIPGGYAGAVPIDFDVFNGPPSALSSL